MDKPKQPKFKIYQDQGEKQDFRWHLVAPNGEIIAAGEGYTTKHSCEKGIKTVKKHAAVAKVV
jgi:uncharacterized protein YegP (UPF0339 family)